MSEHAGVQNWAGGQTPFAIFIEQTRPQLTAEREHWQQQQALCQQHLDRINHEFAAMEAYETVRSGKADKTVKTNAAANGRQRVRRGSRREELLNLIRDGNGLSRGEILERMGLKGDKAGEMSVSNALTAMKRKNQVRREDGKYLPIQAVHQGTLAA